MQPQEMILVSVDDHLVQPPPLIKGRLPIKRAVPLASMKANFDV